VTAVFPATPALRAMRVLGTKSGDLASVTPYLGWLLAQLVAFALVAPLVVRRSWTRIPARWVPAPWATPWAAVVDGRSPRSGAPGDVDNVHMAHQSMHRSHRQDGGAGSRELAAVVPTGDVANTSDAAGPSTDGPAPRLRAGESS
jgi:hypothetical protein